MTAIRDTSTSDGRKRRLSRPLVSARCRPGPAPSLSPATAPPNAMPLTAAIFCALICGLFGANAVAIKIALGGLGVFTTAAVRFSMAGIVIAFWARLTGRPFRLKPGQIRQVTILGMAFTFQLSLFYIGLSRTPASRGTLIANLQPFLVMVIAHFAIPGERITLKKAIGMLSAFSGVVVMVSATRGVPAAFRIGDATIFGAAMTWAASAIYTKRIIDNFRPFQIVLYPLGIAVPLFFLLAVIFDAPMVGHLGPKVIGAMLYQGLVTASFGFVSWNWLLSRYDAVAVNSFVFLMPVTGVLFGGVLLGEPITPNIIAALILIVSGLLVIHIHQKKAAIVANVSISRNV